MKKIGKVILGILEIVIIVFVVSIIVLLMSNNDYGFRQVGDTTIISINDRNVVELDKFKEGDLITLKSKNYNDLNVGDTVYYYTTYKKKYLVVYGTLEKKSGNNREAIYTFKENPDATITNDKIIGTLDKNYSKMGKLFDILTSSVGFLIFVILPILLIFIYQIYKFIILLKEDSINKKKELVNNEKEIIEKANNDQNLHNVKDVVKEEPEKENIKDITDEKDLQNTNSKDITPENIQNEVNKNSIEEVVPDEKNSDIDENKEVSNESINLEENKKDIGETVINKDVNSIDDKIEDVRKELPKRAKKSNEEN